jgi:hypothetical protein
MKTVEFVRVCVGSVFVYVAAAVSCAGSDGADVAGASSSGSPNGESGSSSEAGSSAVSESGSAGISIGVPDAKADPIAGSRLTPVYRVGADGSKEPVPGKWWDTQRKEGCEFVRTSVNEWHCMPYMLETHSTIQGYSDASCTVPITIAVSTRCDVAGLILVSNDDTTCHSTALFDASQIKTAWVSNDGVCEKQLSDYGAHIYQIGTAHNLGDFVSATETH